jgi:hypothetical protein
MRKILKFRFQGRGPEHIETCNYLTPLSVGWQAGPVLWADCTLTEQVFMYKFNVFGIGWEIPEDYTGTFIGTVQGSDGYVYHVYKD